MPVVWKVEGDTTPLPVYALRSTVGTLHLEGMCSNQSIFYRCHHCNRSQLWFFADTLVGYVRPKDRVGVIKVECPGCKAENYVYGRLIRGLGRDQYVCLLHVLALVYGWLLHLLFDLNCMTNVKVRWAHELIARANVWVYMRILSLNLLTGVPIAAINLRKPMVGRKEKPPAAIPPGAYRAAGG